MDDHRSDCVVVSSNRYNDIEPYCTFIYHEQPRIWDSIFPWEFPQNGTKDEEEQFLLRFFSETEAHMQGFRFLKQVWYSIALYNINHRVPEFTKWWLAKPSSIELLNDTDLQTFLLRPDAKPSTFFSDELPQYGDKFLTFVIPYLQNSVRDLLEKHDNKLESESCGGDTIIPQDASKDTSSDAGPTTAQSVDSEGRIVSTTLSLPTPTNMPQNFSDTLAQSSPVGIPRSAPPYSTSSEVARSRVANNQQPMSYDRPFQSQAVGNRQSVQHYSQFQPRVVSNEQTIQQDNYVQSRKRGNSGSRRFNNRVGAHFQARQPHGGNDRNVSMYSSPVYVASPAPTYGHPRVPSGGPMDFMPSLPQGQALPALPPHDQFMPVYFGPVGSMQQPPNPTEAHFVSGHPQQYFANPFGDRSNNHLSDHTFAAQPQVTYYHDPNSFRGGHRRNSQGSRGAKLRGNSANRGKNARGRNSFTSLERPPHLQQGDYTNTGPFANFSGSAHPPKNRRGSGIHEPNWRSGSDNPQIQHNERIMKENMLPRHPFDDQQIPQTSFAPQNQPLNTMPLPARQNFDRSSTTYTPGSHQMNRFKTAYGDPAPRSIDPNALRVEQMCGQKWIGKECTFVNKLVVFDVPVAVPDEVVEDFFKQFGHVKGANRSINNKEVFHDASTLVWVTFFHPSGARNCLLNKPEQWLDDRTLRVEVPKQFWDRSHEKYIFTEPGGPTRPPEESQMATQISSILRRTVESGATTRAPSVEKPVTDETQSSDTTPTPSGASTPKRKYNNKHKGKKEKPDLRKASLTAKGDHKGRSGSGDDRSDANGAAITNITDHQGVVNAASTESNSVIKLDTTAVQKERSASEQTEAQTTSEPAFSPADSVETRLPVPEGSSQQTSPEFLQPGSARTEIQTASELAFTPTDVITNHLPDDVQPFREWKEAPPEEAQAARVDELPVAKLTQVASEPTNLAVTPSKTENEPVDDSFHTASGSPDEDKHDAVEKERVVSDAETATAVTQEADSTSLAEQALAEVDEQLDIVLPTSPDSTISPKSIKKVHVPQLPARSRFTSRSSSSGTKPQLLEPPQHSVSLISPVLPTPAYVTAPNTPGVLQDPSKEDAEEGAKEDAKEDAEEDAMQGPKAEATADAKVDAKPDAEGDVKDLKQNAERAKKVEKPKGPSQTESFSLFGKKKEKKPKGGKKGTVKGKPRTNSNAASDFASGSTSRVVSGAATPNLDQPLGNISATAGKMGKDDGAGTGGEEMIRADSKQPGKSRKASKTSQDAEKVTTEDLAATVTPLQETPSKRKGVRGLLSLLTGGQPFLSSSKADPLTPSKDSLTGAKAQDRHPETETKKLGDTAVDATLRGVVKDHQSQNDSDSGSALGHAPVTGGAFVEDEALGPKVGLGISNASGEASVDQNEANKSKSKKKKKTSKKKAEGSSSDARLSSTPIGESKTVPSMLRFGEDSFSAFGLNGQNVENDGLVLPPSRVTFPAPAADHDAEAAAGAACSEASSRTASLSGEILTPDVQSPTLSTPSKKLPSKRVGSGHLVEAKTPTWKQKKRAADIKRCETPPKSEADDDSVWIISAGSEKDAQPEEPSPKRPEKVYVYVGPGIRVDDAEPTEVEQSREKLKELAREEVKRQKSASTERSLSD